MEATPRYRQVAAGAVVGVKFILVDDPKVFYVGGISGFTTNQDIEALPVETVGTRLAEEHVVGRYAGTVSTNGFFTPEKGDAFVPASSTFDRLKWHAYRFKTVGVDAGVPFDAILDWVVSRATIQQGARGLLTFDMSGPFRERLTGKEAAQRFGTY